VLADSRLLTTREVAELLAVSPETVLRRVRTGELPAIRIASNALRFREAAIEERLAAREVDHLLAAGAERGRQGTDTRTDHFSSPQVLGRSKPGGCLVLGRASAP
jgi:excisionase family DNA binding protein